MLAASLIGVITLLLLWLTNQRLGISTGFENVCSLVVNTPYLRRFDATINIGHAGKMLWIFAGGVLIGAGTRMAGGCTSGHGIFGLSNLERASLVSTLAVKPKPRHPGNVLGGVLFGVLYEHLQRPLGLPALRLGTGDGLARPRVGQQIAVGRRLRIEELAEDQRRLLGSGSRVTNLVRAGYGRRSGKGRHATSSQFRRLGSFGDLFGAVQVA